MKGIIVVLAVAVVLGLIVSPGLAATPAEIDAAIANGLAFLATQQNPDGSFGTGLSYYLIGQTGEAVLTFENEGYFPGGGTAYSTKVENGLDYLFVYAKTQSLNVQQAGNPDSNGNGIGVYFTGGGNEILYETSIAAMAIIGSNTPDRLVTTGPLAGQTYKQVITDVVDYMAWAQNDQSTGTSRGGWRYGPNYGSSDNSVSQWPVLTLVSAEQWGIIAPAWVKTELQFWIDYIQNDVDGGSGYTDPSQTTGVYDCMARTGALLVEMYYVGDTKDTPRVQNAVNYINAHWEDTGGYGNKGNYYAMYAVFKGLERLDIATLPGPGDWYGDYTDWFVTNQNNVDGSWPAATWGSLWLDTSWAILILQGTILPADVTVTVPECAWTTGYDVKVDYSVARFTVDGTLTIYKDGTQFDQVILTDFIGSATYTTTIAPDTAGTHTYKAVLDVTTEQGQNVKIERTSSVMVYQAPTVGDIPDQIAPFTSIDLDSYLTVDSAATVTWAASGADKLVVTIDPLTHVAIVTNPMNSMVAETITFTATATVCSLSADASDSSTFTPNRPPDISQAVASSMCLWPPNNKLVDITINGVTDPDGDKVTISITGVTSDEATATAAGAGGTKFAPDAFIIEKAGTDDNIQLRAERSATADGRVYVIGFTATDGKGGESKGSVTVGVPHDQSPPGEPCKAVDSGQNYDATAIN